MSYCNGYIYPVLLNTVSCIANSKYGNMLILKGGMCLTLTNEDKGKSLNRLTRDIDIHCITRDTWNNFLKDFNAIFNKGDYVYKILNIKEHTTSYSLDIEVYKGENIFRISIDLNIKDYIPDISTYYIDDTKVFCYSVYSMLADKLYTFSKRLINRRAKDIYDLYNLSCYDNYDLSTVVNHIKSKYTNDGKVIDDVYSLNLDNYKFIEHAYNKLEGIYEKPEFDRVYARVQTFTSTIYENLNLVDNKIWDCKGGYWSYDMH